MVSIYQRLKKIGIISSLVICLLAASGLVMSYIFRDEAIQFAIESINKQVNSRIQVQSAHFSIFRKFPNASVEFRQVEMSPAKGFNTDDFDMQYSRNLLSAESIFAEMNLFRLLKKDFRITKIEVRNGKINLLTDMQNRHNFMFWKTRQSADSAASAPVELQNVALRDVDVYYNHKQSSTVISIYAEKTWLNGRFNSQQYSLGVNWQGTVQHFSVDGNIFIRNKAIELSGELDVDSNMFTILKSNLALAKMRMDVSGGFSAGDVVDLNLHVEGKRLDYASLASLAPDQYSNRLRDYPGKGIFSFSAGITGRAGNGNSPRVEVKFAMEKGNIAYRPNNVNMSNLSFNGTFATGGKNKTATTGLHVNSFSCNIGNSSLKGSLSMRNFKTPSVSVKVSGNADIDYLYRFMPIKQIEYAGGKMDGNLSVTAQLKRMPLKSADDIGQLDIQGVLNLNDAVIGLNGRPYRFGHVNGALAFGKTIHAENVSFVLNGNDFLVDGHIGKFVPYLLNRSKTMHFDGTVVSQRLCVDSLLFSEKTAATDNRNQDGTPSRLPENISFGIDLAVKTFRYQNFEAANVNAKLAYQPGTLAMRSVKLAAMSGNVTGSGTIINDAAGNLRMFGESAIRDIDIRKMFRTFGNFSQNAVRAEHLNGALSGDISFVVGWDHKMRLRKEDIAVESSLKLIGGELTGFEPMYSLSRFIALEELKNIKFSTLYTQVFVKNRQITLPETNIETSAFNISGSGIHHFDNSYTYHVKILLSELLAAKARKAKRENSEHEYIETDGKRTSLYLKITGQEDKFKISYDKVSARAAVASDINREKQVLRTILKEEFGWFKRDTANQPAAPANTGKLRFTFDDDPPQETAPETPAKKQKQWGEEEEKIKVDWE
jgi:uncharacterized protein involved in outer membrane biogenesis